MAQEIDTLVVDDVRNFLFGPPGAGGFDLASLNIQRGRDHGLPDYNQVRQDMGLEPVASFDEITSDPEVAAALEELYGDVNNVDVWVGALAEDHVAGSSLGELNQTILVDQFERIRDGDRLWYQNVLSGEGLRRVENTSLADVIERNTEIDGLQDNVFFAADAQPDRPDGPRDKDRTDRPRAPRPPRPPAETAPTDGQPLPDDQPLPDGDGTINTGEDTEAPPSERPDDNPRPPRPPADAPPENDRPDPPREQPRDRGDRPARPAELGGDLDIEPVDQVFAQLGARP